MNLKSTYFLRDQNGVERDLPLKVVNIAAAAAHFDKLTESQKEWRMFERLPTITAQGDIGHRTVDVTAPCIDILWNYYEGSV